MESSQTTNANTTESNISSCHSSSTNQNERKYKSKKPYASKDDEEEARWIYCQIFKEIYYDMAEKDRPPIKEYCQDLYTEENTFNLIGTRRQLIEDYESLRELCKDSNPLVALANLLVDMCDYERAEYFFTKVRASENSDWSRQVNVLNDLVLACEKRNQIDQARAFRELANKINEQNS